MMEASTPEIVITSSGETSNSLDNAPRKRKDSNSLPRIKHGSVPHCEYFLHRCLQIMEDKGKTKDSKKLTDLWQRLSALRRHLSCLRCDELCYFDKVVTHPYRIGSFIMSKICGIALATPANPSFSHESAEKI